MLPSLDMGNFNRGGNSPETSGDSSQYPLRDYSNFHVEAINTSNSEVLSILVWLVLSEYNEGFILGAQRPPWLGYL